jgi:hypothetical protein
MSETTTTRNRQLEIELLLACAGRDIARESSQRVGELLRVGLDWQFLLRMARNHGITPLLYYNLSRGFRDALPKAILEQLRDDFRTNSIDALKLTVELLRILDGLSASGIKAIPFKGPTLAAEAYGDIALRQVGDLDLLVRGADLRVARSFLEARGYRPMHDITRVQEGSLWKSSCQLPFIRGDRRVMVELHTAVTPKAFSFPLDLERLWGRLESIDVMGKRVTVLSPEDLLVILCVHGAKHLWSSLIWISDVAELIRSHPGLDWPWVIRLARKTRSARMLFLGLHLANNLFDVPLTAELQEMIEKEPRLRTLASEVRDRLFSEDLRESYSLEACKFYLRVRERTWDGARFCLSMALTPTVADWTQLSVPSFLSLAYRAFRPIRLVIKYAGRLLASKRAR